MNKTHNEIKMFNLQKMIYKWLNIEINCGGAVLGNSINLSRLSVTRHLFCMITKGDLGNIIWITVPVVFS